MDLPKLLHKLTLNKVGKLRIYPEPLSSERFEKFSKLILYHNCLSMSDYIIRRPYMWFTKTIHEEDFHHTYLHHQQGTKALKTVKNYMNYVVSPGNGVIMSI
jgi:hypothetical protein